MTLESNYLISSMKLKSDPWLLLITYMEYECLGVINILIRRASILPPFLPFYKWKYNFITHSSRDAITLLPFQDFQEYDSR